MKSKMTILISAFFSAFCPFFMRAVRAGITMDAMMTLSRISFFKRAYELRKDRESGASG